MDRRLVLLGASNLVRGFRPLLGAAREVWGDPLEVLAALGHGRSYGFSSAFFFRVLPAILECGLWRVLEERPPRPTRALITDVGNDIAYGVDADRILGWVEECLQRLRAVDAEVVVAGLPLDRLERLSTVGYAAVRAVFFPFHRWRSLGEALARAGEVAEGLQRLAGQHGATFVALRPEWYGIDPIHMRPREWRRAWRTLLFAPDGGAAPFAFPEPAGTPSALRLYSVRPERQWLFGREHRHPQPALALPNGGSVSSY